MTTPNSSVAPLVASGYTLPNYEAVIPEAVRSGKPEHHRLVIVGAGLTGLTLAADLAQRGIDCIVLDEDNTVGVRGASSRGMVYAQKSLEIMDRLGVYQRIRDKGVVWSLGRTLSGDDVVYTFDRAGDNASRQPPFVNIQQFYIEWYLVDRLADLPRAELRWNNRVTGVSRDGSVTRLEVETPEGAYSLTADWVVDAGGANSTVRTLLGIPIKPALSVDRWCICDVRFTKPLPAERWTWVDAPFNGGRAVWQHLMADDVWRLDYQLPPDSDPAEVASLEVATARVREHLGPDVEFELVWVGPWQYRAQMLDDFADGRILFAGDAAHVMSPFGARGGNSGIQDADNLGWKLALVLNGEAPESLLRSYDAERRVAAAENIRVTSQSARFLAPRSPFERRMRRALLGLAREHAFARPIVNTGRLSLPNRYDGTPAVGPEGGFSFVNAPVAEAGSGARWLVEAVGGADSRLLAIHLPRDGRDTSTTTGAIADALAGLPVTVRPLALREEGAPDGALVDAGGEIAGRTGAQPGDLVLLRPDLYCAGVLRGATPDGAAALVRRALQIGE